MVTTGITYSTAHYEHYNQNRDTDYFEEIIEAMILDGIVGMNDSFRNAIMSLDRDKKRMTILSLLDKDLNLFKRIKALTNKNISKMDHIRDIILMLREYVKVGEVEKKKFGEVMTPLELVKEMLNTLPEEVWSNPNLKWLDPANGTGPYPIMVIFKLMNGLKGCPGLEDDEVRYKHIVENMIYVCELQPKNMFLYMCAVDPFDSCKLNIYTGSFLDEGFNFHMKEVWKLDGFDVVVGNPPYQDGGKKEEANKLYPIFIYNSIKKMTINGYCLMVTPTGWFSSTADIGKGKTGISILKVFQDNNLVYLEPDSDKLRNKYFNGVGSTFCYFLYQNNKNYTGTIIGEKKINIKNLESLPKIQNELSFSIIEKYLDRSNNLERLKWIDQNHNLLKEESKVSVGELIHKSFHTPAKGGTYVYSSNIHPYKQKNKVIVSLSGKYLPYKDFGNIGFSNMCGAVLCDSIDEVNDVYLNLNNKLFRFLVENNKFSGFNPRKFIINIPKLKLKSDLYYYSYFNLTQEEVDLIEKTIKD